MAKLGKSLIKRDRWIMLLFGVRMGRESVHVDSKSEDDRSVHPSLDKTHKDSCQQSSFFFCGC